MAETESFTDDFKLLVLEELHRALDLGLSGASERQRNLLTYLVTEELEGRGPRLKAYGIATKVLNRPDSFDAQQDSIVRVEVARLRRALEYYYLTSGADAPVAIVIPKGQYRPVFTRPALALPAPDPATLSRYLDPKLRRLAGAAAAVVLLLAAVVGAALFYYRTSQPPKAARPSHTPVIAVIPFEFSSDRPNLSYVADGLQSELAATLSEFEWLTVVPLGAEAQQRPELAVSLAPDFLTRVSVRLLGDQLLSTAFLLDGATGGVRWTRHYSVPFHADSVESMQRDLAARIAADVGQPYGIVANIERMRARAGADASDEAFLCQLQAFHYWRTFKADDFAQAWTCFDKIRDKNRLDADSLAFQALLALDRAHGHLRGTAREAALAEGRRLADRAYAKANFRAMPRVARYSAAICAGDLDTFRDVARRVAHDYPNHPLVLVDVGAKMVLGSNDASEGLPLIERARALSKNLLVTEVVAPAVDALRRGDFVASDPLRKTAYEVDSLAAIVVQLAQAAARGDAFETERAKARLAEMGVADHKAATGTVDAFCWSKETKALLNRHLDAAYSAPPAPARRDAK